MTNRRLTVPDVIAFLAQAEQAITRTRALIDGELRLDQEPTP